MMFFKKNLSIRYKLFIPILVNIFVLVFCVYLISIFFIFKNYSYIEKDNTIENIQRVRDSLDYTVSQLGVKLSDWAFWDDTYKFMQDNNSAYIVSNLGNNSIYNVRINAMLFVNNKGKIVYKKAIDLNTTKDIPSDNLEKYILNNKDFFVYKNPKQSQGGVVFLPEGPAIIYSKPILNSMQRGPIVGTLVFVKFLDDSLLKSISQITHIPFSIYDFNSPNLQDDILLAKKQLIQNQYFVLPMSGELMAGYTTVPDLRGDPVLILKISLPRIVYHQNQITMYFFMVTLVSVILLLGVVLLYLLEKLIISKLLNLTKNVKDIDSRNKNLTEIQESSGDEISVLSSIIKKTFGDLEQEKIISETIAYDLKKFQLAVENASDQVVITDSNGIVVYVNKVAEVITGFTTEEILGKKAGILWKSFMMPNSFYEEMWHKIKDKKEIFKGQILNKKKNGDIYTAELSISPVLDDSKDIVYFVAIERDVSKEKAFEEQILKEKEIVEQKVVERTQELNNEKARLVASINSIPFGFIVADTNNRIVLKNIAIMNMFQFKTEDSLESSDVVTFLGDNFDVKNVINLCIQNKRIYETQKIIFNKRIFRGIVAPITAQYNPGENNDIIGYVLMLEDITESIALERGRDEFFSIASHELRTPLTAIRGNSQMLKDALKDLKLKKDVFEMIADINESSLRLIDLVNDFLEVSRLEQGRIQIKNKLFDLSSLIQKVIKNMHKMAEDKKIKILFTNKKPFWVKSDERIIQQVLFNLLGNAFKFTSKGKIYIEIEEMSHFVKIKVRDTGIGIPESTQNLLFRKFQQAGEQILARDTSNGTGLGLYICHMLVSKLGGTIGLEESVLGKGSTFAFTLPLNL